MLVLLPLALHTVTHSTTQQLGLQHAFGIRYILLLLLYQSFSQCSMFNVDALNKYQTWKSAAMNFHEVLFPFQRPFLSLFFISNENLELSSVFYGFWRPGVDGKPSSSSWRRWEQWLGAGDLQWCKLVNCVCLGNSSIVCSSVDGEKTSGGMTSTFF